MAIQLRSCILVLLLFACASPPTFGWNDTGHWLVACIAYDSMSPELRRKLVDTIRAHERFHQDFVEAMPEHVRNTDNATKDKWIFLRASVWPDVARGFDGDAKRRFHRFRWHFINTPVFLNDADRAQLQDVGDRRLELPDEFDEQDLNAYQALERSLAIFRDENSSPRQRAVHLCWILHVIGDMHQPLHASALFTPRRFLESDRGGNLIPVRQADNLHSLWDGFLGSNKSFREVSAQALLLVNDAELQECAGPIAGNLDAKAWLAESYRLAEKIAYSDKIRTTVAEFENNADQDLPRIDLSEEYLSRSGRIAKKRVLLAGLRLKGVLENSAD